MSETKNLGLFKHDNPATNTNRFDVDKAINQNLDKIDNAVGQDRERLDLLEASNTIYNYKGKADTLSTIKSKTSKQGDVWYCIEDSTYYAYNGTDWIPVNLNLKLGVIDELQAKTIKVLQEVETPTPVTGTEINIKDSAEAKITELNINGNSKQETRSGRNLYNYKDTKLVSNDSTVDEEGWITVSYDNSNGTSTVYKNYYTNNLNLETNTSYNVIAEIKNVSGTGSIQVISNSNNDGQFSETMGYAFESLSNNTIKQANKITKSDFTNDTNALRTFISFSSGQSGSITFRLSVLEDTSITVDTFKYEAYGVSPSPDYPSEIKSCGDNIQLFNKDNANIINAYFTPAGVFTLNSGNRSAYIEIEPNTTYTISKEKGNIFRAGTTNTLLSGGETVNNFVVSSDNKTITIKSGTSDKYLYVNYAQTSENETMLNSLKIEKGTTASKYSPYGQGCVSVVIENGLKTTDANYKSQIYNIPTQQPFRTIGDVKDTFVKVNNEWYEKHYIKEFVLDGSETYTKSSSYADDTYFCGYLSSKLTDFSAGNSILNSHFKIGKYDKVTDEECMANEAQFHVRILASRLSENSSNGVKEWFANNNTIVNYVSTTPTLIKCTEEQSTILWNIEQNAKTYKNVTNIYSEDEVSPNIEITYKKDIETLFANTLVESGV